MYFRGFAAWLLIVLGESIHGTLRQVYLAPMIGDFPARRVAFFSGMVIIFFIALAVIRWVGPRSLRQCFIIGSMWAVLTLMFEFGIGVAMGYSRERMLEDYDLSRGGLMIFGIIFLMVVPLLAYRVRNRSWPAAQKEKAA